MEAISTQERHQIKLEAKRNLEIEQLTDEMEKEVQNGLIINLKESNIVGDDMITKIPSLKIKKWNATRWLGRNTCLTTFCNALEYVLDHLQLAKDDMSLTPTTREQARELYMAITNYENFLFFYYKDVTAILAQTSRMLQYEEIQISDVGRYINILCEKLKISHPLSAMHPIELLASGHVDKIIQDLFGDNFDGI